MTEILIHPSAIVSPKARLGTGVRIGAFAVIADDVEIGDNTEIQPLAVVHNGARIGVECRLFSGCVIAGEPQDLKFKGEPTLAIIGDRTVVRECSTVNRGTAETSKTEIGAGCLIMAYSHVAHDCKVGDRVILSNCTQLAGHVTIEDWAILGGMAKVVQFCSIGAHSMIGADVKITKDTPPFALVGRDPARIEGINKIGLRRRNFTDDAIAAIEQAYNAIFFSGRNITDGINYCRANKLDADPEVAKILSFIERSKKGVLR
ncbi:acyl-ACP--UDP-N-acetylglucosamine O-acyltransferase [Ignavibacteria bacterium]|jgi:UDP-N-acetylglucosamine acyltransferase|nr:acyl-ACP--UDP-N-acetylglucosamine O-acyltransferase [Bacteroidota bacterium]MCZ2133162.1 acyl-ACP--UDP-N-acetylglucosamine O-acyltransferase [Bacteroidota bacterium]